MKAQKVTLIIEIQVLSIDAAPSILMQATEQINKEVESGTLSMQDGDIVTWNTTRTPVQF